MTKHFPNRQLLASFLILMASLGTSLWTTAEGGDPRCYDLREWLNPVYQGRIDGTLHISSSKGALELVEKLLNAGANADVANSYGYAPLHVAAFTGQTAIAEALLNAGADPNAIPKEASSSRETLERCGGVTPLHFAAASGHVEIVSALLLAGADANAAAQNGTTPIYWADKGGHVDAVVALLEAGADH